MSCGFALCPTLEQEAWIYKVLITSFLLWCVSELYLPILREYKAKGYQRSMAMFIMLGLSGSPVIVCFMLNGLDDVINKYLLLRIHSMIQVFYSMSELRICIARLPFDLLSPPQRKILMTTCALQIVWMFISVAYTAAEVATIPREPPRPAYYLMVGIFTIFIDINQIAAYFVTKEMIKTVSNPRTIETLELLCKIGLWVFITSSVGLLHTTSGTLLFDSFMFLPGGYTMLLYGKLQQAKDTNKSNPKHALKQAIKEPCSIDTAKYTSGDKGEGTLNVSVN